VLLEEGKTVDRILGLDGDEERWWRPAMVDQTAGTGALKQGRGECWRS
jgi:hypothetical protein